MPKTWREAPGMVMAGFFNLPTSRYISLHLPISPCTAQVMAGFFFARAGVRPIIFLKEVLDYQVRVRLRVRVRVRDRGLRLGIG